MAGGKRGPVSGGGFREQLSVPWWAHPVVLAVSVVLGLESAFLAGGVGDQAVLRQGAVVVVFAALGELVVWRYGSRIVEVTGGPAGTVRAGSWRLPVSRVRAVAVLDAAATKRELRNGDEAVYRCTRSWVPTAVLLDVDDPDDQPLWLVSTRHPHLLAAALADAAQEQVDTHAAAGPAQQAGSPSWTRTPGDC